MVQHSEATDLDTNLNGGHTGRPRPRRAHALLPPQPSPRPDRGTEWNGAPTWSQCHQISSCNSWRRPMRAYVPWSPL